MIKYLKIKALAIAIANIQMYIHIKQTRPTQSRHPIPINPMVKIRSKPHIQPISSIQQQSYTHLPPSNRIKKIISKKQFKSIMFVHINTCSDKYPVKAC